MALVFMDGFNYGSYTQALAYGGYVQAGVQYLGTTYGRFGGIGVGLSSNTGSKLSKVISGLSTVIIGFAFKTSNFAGTGGPYVLSFREGTTAHLTLRKDPSTNLLSLYHGNNTLLAADTTTPLGLNVWNYLEIKVTIHDTAGAYEVRVNGSTIMSATNVDTRNGGTSGVIDTFLFGSVVLDGACYAMDDLYICDTTGSTNNDFLGDVKVVRLSPNADGDSTQFTPLSGSNWQNVDDTNYDDGASTYVSSSTAGNIDLYNLATLADNPQSIKAVRVVSIMSKDDTGALTARNVLKTGSTTYNGTTESPGVGYGIFTTTYETNPNTSSAWTKSDIDSLQVGVERVS